MDRGPDVAASLDRYTLSIVFKDAVAVSPSSFDYRLIAHPA
jgi:hypothetical protein